MPAYLTLDQFKALSVMPGVFVDQLEAVAPGWLGLQLSVQSARIDSRLAKRYATPFAVDSVPLAVQQWLAKSGRTGE